MYISIGTVAVGAVILFLSGAVFGVLIMAVMNAASAADRDEIEYLDINAPTEQEAPTPVQTDEEAITEDEIRSHPHYAKNYEAFMQKYHPDVLEDPCTKWSSDIYDEYIEWCQSPEGRVYFEE